MDSDPSYSSKVETIFQTIPRKTQSFAFKPIVAIAVVSILSSIFAPTGSASPSSDFESAYDRHCSHVVPRSARSPLGSNTHEHLSGLPSSLRSGYFLGGAPILNQTLDSDGKSLYFTPFSAQRTFSEGVLELKASLSLRGLSDSSGSMIDGGPGYTRSNFRLNRFRRPRLRSTRRQFVFELKGFWSQVSAELCMVGSGKPLGIGKSNDRSVSVVLKLQYPLNSTIYGSLVKGSLESLESGDSGDYFAPVSVLAVDQDSSHEYVLAREYSGCLSGDDGLESVRVSSLPGNGCSVLRRREKFDLEYGGDCNGNDCNPLGGGLGFVPSHMVYYRTQCGKDKKWQMMLGFPNTSSSDYIFSFNPITTFIGEGEWNEKGDRFCGIACRILNTTGGSFDNAYVGDCSVGFSIRFPTSMSLKNRDNIVGKIWSTRAANSSGYFGEIGFNGFNPRLMSMLGVKYEYSVIDDAFTASCMKKNSATGKGKKYPTEYSSDMTFDMSVKDSKGLNAFGYSIPIYVGDQANKNQLSGFGGFYPNPTVTEFSVMSNNSHSSLVNISYEISFTVPTGTKFVSANSSSNEVKISAEGIYYKDSGVLCMIGCRKFGSKIQNAVTSDTLDCEIAVNIQFSPLDAKTSQDVKGTIESTREPTDPLYFEHLELSSISIYRGQAEASIWRMDLEIIMVLISKTLACVFVGLQLFYIKSHPDVLPYTSIVMLVILTVGHMIPLLLNFEALFVSHRAPQDDLLGSGGWLEANEVIVRIVTMVAFLLQLRLFQQTWSLRKGDVNEKSLWSSERKVFKVTFPLYLCGALIAWLANRLKNSSGLGIPNRAFRNPHRRTYVVTPFKQRSFQQHSLWEDLKSYAGLVMDGFLLPQILFNLFADSDVKALAPLFYAGTTVVRLLPHAYDLYRAHAFTSYLDLSYIYASHRMDYYSTAWDIVIPGCGLLFAILIFLQQRFGGRFIFPRRFRQKSMYEEVPVISNEDL